jgi:uncharacterized membrane protein
MEYVLKLKEEKFSNNYIKHFKEGLPQQYKITGNNKDIRFIISNKSFELHSPSLIIRKTTNDGYFVPVMVKRGVVDIQTSDESVAHVIGYFDCYSDESKLYNIVNNDIQLIKDPELIRNIKTKVKGGQ